MIRTDRCYVIADSCPWPERVGLIAYEVVPEGTEGLSYPFAGIGRDEVVVSIPNDPLPNPHPGWSCVMLTRSLARVVDW